MTAGQTIGPFFGFALPYAGGSDLVPPTHPDAIRLHGRVIDGAGDPVPDAVLEIWQSGPDGAVRAEAGSLHRDGWTFTGWGRAATDGAGRYSFSTLLPGPPDALPFISMTVFARGLLDRLFTRAYLPLAGRSPEADPLFASLAPDRRATLLAEPENDGYRFDVVLQGPDETVFLAITSAR